MQNYHHAEMNALYVQALKDYPAHDSITLLYVSDHSTLVGARNDKGFFEVWALNIGLHKAASSSGNAMFNSYPPTPLDLENAIMVVEDEIMPLAKLLPHPSTLVITDELAHLLKLVVDDDRSIFSIDEIEDIFRKLAEVSEGSPMLSSGLPMRSDFAAAVLIVREFMHHLGFKFVMLSKQA